MLNLKKCIILQHLPSSICKYIHFLKLYSKIKLIRPSILSIEVNNTDYLFIMLHASGRGTMGRMFCPRS